MAGVTSQSLCFLGTFPWVVGLGLMAEAPMGWWGGGVTHSRLQRSDLTSLFRPRGLAGVRPMRMDTRGLCAGVRRRDLCRGAGGRRGGSDADWPPLLPQRRAGSATQAPSPMKRAEAPSPLGAPPTV